jgi:hypothetical protein
MVGTYRHEQQTPSEKHGIHLLYQGKSVNKGFQQLADCLRLEALHIEIVRNTTAGTRDDDKVDLCVANGLKQLRKVRCKEVVVKREDDGYWGGEFTDENVKKFEDMLKEELCQERKEVKKRVPKGHGKKAMAAAKKNGKSAGGSMARDGTLSGGG